MMLLVAVVLVLLWLFQIVFLDQFYQNIRISSLEKQGKEIIASIEETGSLSQGINLADLQNWMESYAYTNQISADIIDQGQKTLYEADYSNSMMMGRGMMMNVNSEVATTALSGEAARLKTSHPRFGTEYMLIGLPITIGDTVTGAMLLTVPLAPVKDTVAILKQQLFLITLILIAVTVLISYYLSKSFTTPIIKLYKLAESYSEGSFDQRIRIKREDELGILAERMNKMGEDLARNEQLRKDLIANVSHELRTPLSLIRGYAETLRDVTGDNPVKREKQLGVIVDETERLSKIVADILSLSQFQAGGIALDQKSFSLNQMLSDVMQRYETAGLPREFSLKGDTDREIFVLADQGRMEQVLYNLINNAVQHTKEDGRISVKAIDSPRAVRIEVTDDGKGIAEEELPNVFDRYYRGGKEERSKSGGTGLGLAIVKSILQMHQVPFGVQSQLGAGTTFWFELHKDNSHTSF
jgi:signal transduction histidine kinase